jgi:hypothetical protein
VDLRDHLVIVVLLICTGWVTVAAVIGVIIGAVARDRDAQVPPSEPVCDRRGNDRFVRRCSPFALPEAGPGADDWARLLWPWLDAVERLGIPRPAAALARLLAPLVDVRDGTVNTERVRAGTLVPGTGTRFTQRRALATLVDAGLLVPASPGRHRLVVPPPRQTSR